MAVAYLVRHGQASFGAADYDVLSEAGRAQSAVLGAELARRGVVPDRVVTGSSARARETPAVALGPGRARRGAPPARVVPGSMARQRDPAALALAAARPAGSGPAPEVDERWNEY